MDKFLERIDCEWGGFNQGPEEQVEAIIKIANKAFEFGKKYDKIYTDVVTDGVSSYMVFATEPFDFREAQDWFDFLLDNCEDD